MPCSEAQFRGKSHLQDISEALPGYKIEQMECTNILFVHYKVNCPIKPRYDVWIVFEARCISGVVLPAWAVPARQAAAHARTASNAEASDLCSSCNRQGGARRTQRAAWFSVRRKGGRRARLCRPSVHLEGGRSTTRECCSAHILDARLFSCNFCYTYMEEQEQEWSL